MPLAAAFLLLLQSAPLPELKLVQAGSSWQVQAGEFRKSGLPAVQDAVMAQAKQRCGQLSIRWGRFSWSTRENGTTDETMVDFKQKFSCFDPATDPYKAVAADWQPSDQDDADASAFALRYLAAIDAGNVAVVKSMEEPLLDSTPEERSALVTDARGRASPAGRQWRSPQWARNPDGFAHPGAYAYLVFVAPRSCGALVIYRVAAGSYQLTSQQIYGVMGAAPLSDVDRKTLQQRCDQF